MTWIEQHSQLILGGAWGVAIALLPAWAFGYFEALRDNRNAIKSHREDCLNRLRAQKAFILWKKSDEEPAHGNLK